MDSNLVHFLAQIQNTFWDYETFTGYFVSIFLVSKEKYVINCMRSTNKQTKNKNRCFASIFLVYKEKYLLFIIHCIFDWINCLVRR